MEQECDGIDLGQLTILIVLIQALFLPIMLCIWSWYVDVVHLWLKAMQEGYNFIVTIEKFYLRTILVKYHPYCQHYDMFSCGEVATILIISFRNNSITLRH